MAKYFMKPGKLSEIEQHPVGALPSTYPFHGSCFLFVGNRFHSSSYTFLNTTGQNQTVIGEGRECRNKGGEIKKQ